MVHKCNKAVEIATIQTDIEYMKEKIDEIHISLVGNGKPGLINEYNRLKGSLTATKVIFGFLYAVSMVIIALN